MKVQFESNPYKKLQLIQYVATMKVDQEQYKMIYIETKDDDVLFYAQSPPNED